MPRISVLMSVYNETESQIVEAVESLMQQSFSDFELIIVDDAPDNEKITSFLLGMTYPRTKVLVNETNCGLALSMNRAAEVAVGDYLARMDADDICLPTRFEKEFESLESGKYDLVFTNYIYIDEGGNQIEDRAGSCNYSDNEICSKLLEANIIHHPTVMFKRELFFSVKGYRNYPCSQDYDLWLRMIEKKCRFHMIDEVLFMYRIRNNSISSTKRLQQKLTLDYARDCFIERIVTGKDPYSYGAYKDYIEEKEKNSNASFENSRLLLQKAKKCRAHKNYIGYIWYRCVVFMTDKVYRNSYLKKIKAKRVLRKYFSN